MAWERAWHNSPVIIDIYKRIVQPIPQRVEREDAIEGHNAESPRASSAATQRTGTGLSHGPSLFTRYEMLEIAFPQSGNGLVVLPAYEVAVAIVVDGSEHAQRLGEIGVAHPAQQERQARLGGLFVVDQQVVGADGFRVDDLGGQAVQANALGRRPCRRPAACRVRGRAWCRSWWSCRWRSCRRRR